RNTIFLAEQGFYPVGVDVASTALEIALRRADRAGLKNCLFIKIDFLRLSLRNRGFDAVISCYGIENQSLSGIRKALKEVKRIATDRGLVLVTLHSTKHWRFGLG
ncbi:methyltransferase domain-containing protein, partial [Candidatus Bathyarchaeota archaeon]|nr:class I SAM-dependent methyltransferase [Candidatus Bathyarchaeota archaeon]NIU81415.1 methyltransferase domain-containing protein [Candidatus Bathyarchaeota archaeon]NIV68050.1 methyltransferase domain-containing protein [Candidatus Bathyarchaeota archaeon]NIW34579.1 methyltransferase domain-containing protein [Candidatus Bathyarchaeota archaeon]